MSFRDGTQDQQLEQLCPELLVLHFLLVLHKVKKGEDKK